MIRFLIFFLILFAFSTNSNEVSIVELHKKKTLDQLVLEDEINENEIIDSNIENNDEALTQDNNSNEESVNGSSLIESDLVDIQDFYYNLEINQLILYFDNIKSINSLPLYNEFIKILTEYKFSNNKEVDEQIFHLFIKKLIEVGEIQKAYYLIKSQELSNYQNIEFYKTIELNYLFSTYQLNEACELKNDFNEENIKLQNYYLEKADIFCLILEEKFDEANLLNSILIETELNEDLYFQDLLNLLIDFTTIKQNKNILLPQDYNKNLIFLYSAMLRIAELPLSEEFLNIDPNNLAIPIILSNSSQMNLRLKAAHTAYLNNSLSIESLAALYQSVDFNSEQLNNPIKTLEEIKNNSEIIMSYYYQLANIQIFPTSRLEVIMDFWEFAESVGLEKISYNLTYNIISSIEPSIENSNYGSKIANALIYNADFEKASKWILFAENSNLENDTLQKVQMFYDLYQSADYQKIIDYININYEDLIQNESKNIKETLYVIQNILNDEKIFVSNLIFDNVIDDRKIPTIYITSKIEEAIINNDQINLFILLLVSLSEKNWDQVHPQHLQLVLKGIKNYKNSELLKNTLLDIFEKNKIF